MSSLAVPPSAGTIVRRGHVFTRTPVDHRSRRSSALHSRRRRRLAVDGQLVARRVANRLRAETRKGVEVTLARGDGKTPGRLTVDPGVVDGSVTHPVWSR